MRFVTLICMFFLFSIQSSSSLENGCIKEVAKTMYLSQNNANPLEIATIRDTNNFYEQCRDACLKAPYCEVFVVKTQYMITFCYVQRSFSESIDSNDFYEAKNATLYLVDRLCWEQSTAKACWVKQGNRTQPNLQLTTTKIASLVDCQHACVTTPLCGVINYAVDAKRCEIQVSNSTTYEESVESNDGMSLYMYDRNCAEGVKRSQLCWDQRQNSRFMNVEKRRVDYTLGACKALCVNIKNCYVVSFKKEGKFRCFLGRFTPVSEIEQSETISQQYEFLKNNFTNDEQYTSFVLNRKCWESIGQQTDTWEGRTPYNKYLTAFMQPSYHSYLHDCRAQCIHMKNCYMIRFTEDKIEGEGGDEEEGQGGHGGFPCWVHTSNEVVINHYNKIELDKGVTEYLLDRNLLQVRAISVCFQTTYVDGKFHGTFLQLESSVVEECLARCLSMENCDAIVALPTIPIRCMLRISKHSSEDVIYGDSIVNRVIEINKGCYYSYADQICWKKIKNVELTGNLVKSMPSTKTLSECKMLCVAMQSCRAVTFDLFSPEPCKIEWGVLNWFDYEELDKMITSKHNAETYMMSKDCIISAIRIG